MENDKINKSKEKVGIFGINAVVNVKSSINSNENINDINAPKFSYSPKFDKKVNKQINIVECKDKFSDLDIKHNNHDKILYNVTSSPNLNIDNECNIISIKKKILDTDNISTNITKNNFRSLSRSRVMSFKDTNNNYLDSRSGIRNINNEFNNINISSREELSEIAIDESNFERKPIDLSILIKNEGFNIANLKCTLNKILLTDKNMKKEEKEIFDNKYIYDNSNDTNRKNQKDYHKLMNYNGYDQNNNSLNNELENYANKLSKNELNNIVNDNYTYNLICKKINNLSNDKSDLSSDKQQISYNNNDLNEVKNSKINDELNVNSTGNKFIPYNRFKFCSQNKSNIKNEFPIDDISLVNKENDFFNLSNFWNPENAFSYKKLDFFNSIAKENVRLIDFDDFNEKRKSQENKSEGNNYKLTYILNTIEKGKLSEEDKKLEISKILNEINNNNKVIQVNNMPSNNKELACKTTDKKTNLENLVFTGNKIKRNDEYQYDYKNDINHTNKKIIPVTELKKYFENLSDYKPPSVIDFNNSKNENSNKIIKETSNIYDSDKGIYKYQNVNKNEILLNQLVKSKNITNKIFNHSELEKSCKNIKFKKDIENQLYLDENDDSFNKSKSSELYNKIERKKYILKNLNSDVNIKIMNDKSYEEYKNLFLSKFHDNSEIDKFQIKYNNISNSYSNLNKNSLIQFNDSENKKGNICYNSCYCCSYLKNIMQDICENKISNANSNFSIQKNQNNPYKNKSKEYISLNTKDIDFNIEEKENYSYEDLENKLNYIFK